MIITDDELLSDIKKVPRCDAVLYFEMYIKVNVWKYDMAVNFHAIEKSNLYHLQEELKEENNTPEVYSVADLSKSVQKKIISIDE